MSQPWRPRHKSENPWISHTVAAHKAAGTVPYHENIYDPYINDEYFSNNSNNAGLRRHHFIPINISQRIEDARENIERIRNGESDRLSLDGLGLTDLSDFPGVIEVLDRLTSLSCSFNPITDLPNLRKKAPMLRYLYCVNTHITELPPLPDTLTFLNCQSSGTSVISKSIHNPNGLRRLPRPLPPELKYLYCSYNSLIYLPPLPSTLLSLAVEFNQLKELPELPPRLTYLYINNNQLRFLPKLPTTLIYIQAKGNPLEAPFNYSPLNMLLTKVFLTPNDINMIRPIIKDYWDNKTVETLGAEMVNPESHLSARTGKRTGYGFPTGPNVTLLQYLNISQNKKSFNQTRANLRTRVNPNPLSNVNTGLFKGGTRRSKRSKYTRRK